jgi:hypothetical protein
MGKHLAEKAVVELVNARGLPFCIVRPSLVSSVAAEPYAGYSGERPGGGGGRRSGGEARCRACAAEQRPQQQLLLAWRLLLID